jgi:hypothetical protein
MHLSTHIHATREVTMEGIGTNRWDDRTPLRCICSRGFAGEPFWPEAAALTVDRGTYEVL